MSYRPATPCDALLEMSDAELVAATGTDLPDAATAAEALSADVAAGWGGFPAEVTLDRVIYDLAQRRVITLAA